MKKALILSVTMAILLGATSTCFAGFGVKVPGAKASKPAATISGEKQEDKKLETETEVVDLNDVMAHQKEMTRYMLACNNAAANGWVALNNATGHSVTEILAAQTKMNESQSAEDGDECATAMAAAANVTVDEAKVVANAAVVREAIAKAKADKLTAETARTNAAIKLPAATQEITKCTKLAMKDLEFAKRLNPVKKVYNLNKKMISATDKNLKAMAAHITKLEEILKKANA